MNAWKKLFFIAIVYIWGYFFKILIKIIFNRQLTSCVDEISLSIFGAATYNIITTRWCQSCLFYGKTFNTLLCTQRAMRLWKVFAYSRWRDEQYKDAYAVNQVSYRHAVNIKAVKSVRINLLCVVTTHWFHVSAARYLWGLEKKTSRLRTFAGLEGVRR